MNTARTIVGSALVLGLACSAFAGAPPPGVTVQIQFGGSCVNPGAGATFPASILFINASGMPFTPGYTWTLCSNVMIGGVSPDQGNMPPGGTFTPGTCPTAGPFGGVFTATGTVPDNGQTNSAFVALIPGSNPPNPVTLQASVTFGSSKPVTESKSIPTCTTSSPGLHISKTASSAVRNGDIFDFTITVTNTAAGPSPAYEVNDSVPGLTILGVSDNCDLLGGTAVNCEGPSLPGGGTATYKVKCIANGFGTQTNTAVLSGDGVPTQQASASVELEPLRFLEVGPSGPALADVHGRP